MPLLPPGRLPFPARRAYTALLCLTLTAHLPAQIVPTRMLTELSIEELMQVEITSVSKHAEKLARAPAAIAVLMPDDLRRGGAQNIPEALRLVPGLQVARMDAHNWAITSRGFADNFSNKLLVLRDGRSLYTPLFSGVFWDVQDTMMADLERIEVVRGPGATLWGSNAVNGVINILSKPAYETQGSLVVASLGTDFRESAAVRHGGVVGSGTHYRVYGKFSRYADLKNVDGGSAHDGQQLTQAGFRVDDRNSASARHVTLQGDVYNGRENQLFHLPQPVPPFTSVLRTGNRIAGHNLLGRWTERQGTERETMLQAYYDVTERETAIFGEKRRTFDLEVQQRLAGLANHDITAGFGYRTTADEVRNTPGVTLTPASRRTHLWSGFVQDHITLVPQRWHVIPGTKLEHNDFTGWELQPGARLLFTPNPRHTGWASVAHAARTPSRAESDVVLQQVTTTPGVLVRTVGNREFRSEQLTAYELGYRFHAGNRSTFDLALFYNDYARLRTMELDGASLVTLARLRSPAPPPLPVVITTLIDNKLAGHTFGGEMSFTTQATRRWRVRTSYSHLQVDLKPTPGIVDFAAARSQGNSPRHQATFWSQHDFSDGWRLDWRVRHVSRLPGAQLPAYTELDARIGWRPVERWELSVVGQNLLRSKHREFAPFTLGTPNTAVSRGVYFEARYGY